MILVIAEKPVIGAEILRMHCRDRLQREITDLYEKATMRSHGYSVIC